MNFKYENNKVIDLFDNDYSYNASSMDIFSIGDIYAVKYYVDDGFYVAVVEDNEDFNNKVQAYLDDSKLPDVDLNDINSIYAYASEALRHAQLYYGAKELANFYELYLVDNMDNEQNVQAIQGLKNLSHNIGTVVSDELDAIRKLVPIWRGEENPEFPNIKYTGMNPSELEVDPTMAEKLAPEEDSQIIERDIILKMLTDENYRLTSKDILGSLYGNYYMNILFDKITDFNQNLSVENNSSVESNSNKKVEVKPEEEIKPASSKEFLSSRSRVNILKKESEHMDKRNESSSEILSSKEKELLTKIDQASERIKAMEIARDEKLVLADSINAEGDKYMRVRNFLEDAISQKTRM